MVKLFFYGEVQTIEWVYPFNNSMFMIKFNMNDTVYTNDLKYLCD